MNLKAFIAKRPVLTFFALVIIVSWTLLAVIVGPSHLPLAWEHFARLGVPIYGAILAGPVLPSLLLTGLLGGRTGLRELLQRLCKWRVGARWYGLALVPALAMTTTFLALPLISSDLTPSIFASDHKARLLLLGTVLGLMIGSFEEIGWTGFAIPRLRLRYGILSTGVIVGLVWGAWHFPLFWQDDSFSAAAPFGLLLVRLFSWLLPFRVLLVWVYDRTGSLLVPMLMHGCVSAVSVVLTTTAESGVALWITALAWPLMMWLLVAIVAVANRFAERASHV